MSINVILSDQLLSSSKMKNFIKSEVEKNYHLSSFSYPKSINK